MRTEKQQQASRENGARSHGPATPEGKAASARNSTKHGLTSKNPILLNVEDREAFDHLRQEYEDLLLPANVIERQLVDEMVSVQWRRQRAEAIEAAHLNFSMDRMANDIAARFDRIDDATRVSLACDHQINESRSLQNVQRIAERLSRQYLRLLKAFRNLREHPIPPPENEIRQNEPEPVENEVNSGNIVEFPGRPATQTAPPDHSQSPSPAPSCPETAPESEKEDHHGVENH